MGMDAHLLRVRNINQPKTSDFWDKVIDLRDKEAWENDDYTSPAQLWYGRKFWDLHEFMFPTAEYECGEYVEITKPMLERMVDYAARHIDYFGGFDRMPELCQALYEYDNARARGWIYVYEADW